MKHVVFKLLVKCEEIESTEMTYVLNSVKLPEVREALGTFFCTFTQPHLIINQGCFNQFGWFCFAYLDQLDIYGFEDLSQLESLLQMSQLIYVEKSQRRQYLSDVL